MDNLQPSPLLRSTGRRITLRYLEISDPPPELQQQECLTALKAALSAEEASPNLPPTSFYSVLTAQTQEAALTPSVAHRLSSLIAHPLSGRNGRELCEEEGRVEKTLVQHHCSFYLICYTDSKGTPETQC